MVLLARYLPSGGFSWFLSSEKLPVENRSSSLLVKGLDWVVVLSTSFERAANEKWPIFTQGEVGHADEECAQFY